VKKWLIIPALLIILLASSCQVVTGENSGVVNSTASPADATLARMLEYVPYSFLEEHDIAFSDPAAVKELYGLEGLTSREAVEQVPQEELVEKLGRLSAVPSPQAAAIRYDLAPFVGWDWLIVDRAVFHDAPPPWGFSVMEGHFDEDLIAAKLAERGYEKAAYGDHTYYRINNDMQIDMRSELGRMVMAQLNRVAILDDTVVTAPASDIMTGVLDARDGKTMSVWDDPSARAVIDSLRDAVAATLIPADRVMNVSPTQTPPPFNLPAAREWGALHSYDMVGLGYRDNGQDRYWDISLHYDAEADAEADAAELVSRLNSYVFYTGLPRAETYSLTSRWEVGKPAIEEDAAGATLTVPLRYLPGTRGSGEIFNIIVQARDLLFLAPDPSPYLATESGTTGGPSGLFERIDQVGELGAALEQNEPETFAGCWLENMQTRFVIAFTSGGEETIRKYVKEGSPLDNYIDLLTFDVTYAELRAEQQAAIDLLDSLDLFFVTNIDVKSNRAEVYITDSELYEKALEAAGASLPPHVLPFVVYEPLREPPFPVNPDPSLHFPQLKVRSGMFMEALLVGELEMEDGYLYVGDNIIVWQPDYFLDNNNGTIEILDRDGNVVGRVGEEIVMGGGGWSVDDVNRYLKEPLPPECDGPFFLQGAETRLGPY
jgi:hypothetical protein